MVVFALWATVAIAGVNEISSMQHSAVICLPLKSFIANGATSMQK